MVLDLKIINKEAALDHINALAFNRTASTVGETNARNYIKNELSGADIDCIVEHFYWSGFASLILKVVNLIILSLIILYKQYIIFVIYIGFRGVIKNRLRKSHVEGDRSSNILTLIPSEEKNTKKTLIIFSAHYDSVVSRYPYRVHIFLNLIMKLVLLPLFSFTLFLSLLIMFGSYFNLQVDSFYVYLIVISSILGILISPMYIFIFEKNNIQSTGSVDNASGVAILLEIAKFFKARPLKNIDLLFLWAGAEEWGLKGSKSFCKKYMKYLKGKYDLNKSININIDMVGSYLGFYNGNKYFQTKNKKRYIDLMNVISENFDIPLINYKTILTPKSDHITFNKYKRKLRIFKFQTLCFHSIKDRKYIHTPKDTPDLCSAKNLNNCIKLCLYFTRYIDFNAS